MPFASSSVWKYAIVSFTVQATIVSLGVIAVLILFIWSRRTYRSRYFARRDETAREIRNHWERYLNNPTLWTRSKEPALYRELLETVLLDKIEVSDRAEFPRLLRCLQCSGLLDLRIREARSASTWKRQAALVALGRSRAPEAIPALTEALQAREKEVVSAAVRGLGRIALPQAAIPILDGLVESRVNVPPVILKNALVSCCRDEPGLIVRYMLGAAPQVREILCRTLAEIATPWLGDEMAILAADPLPEVRASAARALAEVHPDLAVPLLSTLTMDSAWFVRVRAVNSLAALHDATAIKALARMCCDSNRIVRQRAAIALVEFEEQAVDILHMIVNTGDRYALQAFLSELQRHGRYAPLFERLTQKPIDARDTRLLSALQGAMAEISHEPAAAEAEPARQDVCTIC